METIRLLRDEEMSKSLFKLGLPVVIAMLIMAVYNVVDTFWVARLGTLEIAAVSVAFPISLFFTGVGLTFGVGAGAYISRLLGAKQEEKASNVASVSIITALLIGLIISGICYIFLPKLLYFMGGNDSFMPLAKGYARLFIFSCIIGTVNIASSNIIVSQGASKISGLTIVIGAVVNMGLDPLFIYTFRMGVNGAAWATIVSQVVSFSIFVGYFRKSSVKVSFKFFKPSLHIYVEVVKIGIAMLFFQIFQTLSISLLQKAAVKYGSAAIAAVGIVLKIITLGTNVVFGFVKGFQPIAGYNYGAGNYKRLKEAIRHSLIITTAFCVIWSIIIFLFTQPIVDWFGDDEAVKEITALALRANTIMFFTFGLQFVYSTLYMAMGKAAQSFILNISRQGIFFIPVILILPHYFGLNGVLFTQAVADFFTTLLTAYFAWRVRMGGCKHKDTKSRKNKEQKINKLLLKCEFYNILSSQSTNLSTLLLENQTN